MSEPVRASRRCPACGARVRGSGTSCAACGARLPWRLTLGGVVVESALAAAVALAAVGGLLWWRSGGHVPLPDGGRIRDLVAQAPTDVPTPTPEPPASPTRPPSTPFPPTPTPLPAVISHTIASGDTLFGLGLEHGVTLDDIRAANPDIESLDRLQIGQVIRIPVPGAQAPEEPLPAADELVAAAPDAATPPAEGAPEGDAGPEAPPADPSAGDGAPEGAPEDGPPSDGAAAATALAIAAPTGIPIVVTEAVTHAIAAGDTLGALAVAYETALDDLLAWNDLLDPNETLSVGRELVVRPEVVVTATPLPVPERMADAVAGGAALPAEEAQRPAAPTFAAPVALSPVQGTAVSGDPPLLRWTSAGVLPPGHFYVVAIRDAADDDAPERLTWVRGSGTALRLPPRWRPAVGASRTLAWSVSVRRASGGLLETEGVVVSGEPAWQTFVWTPRGDASAEAPER